jgi:hypothetical protein
MHNERVSERPTMFIVHWLGILPSVSGFVKHLYEIRNVGEFSVRNGFGKAKPFRMLLP